MLLAIVLSLTSAPTSTVEPNHDRELMAAMASIQSGHPDTAITTVDPIIAVYTAQQAAEKREVYCGMSLPQQLLYMGRAAQHQRGGVVLPSNYCTALFIKGFALVDLKRLPEARSYYERAVALAPMDAHFTTELGQTYRLEKNWPVMLEKCTSAANIAKLAREDTIKIAQTAAWRCMGFALTEQHKLDEAAALYQKCLALDPTDARATRELAYIAQQKSKQP